MKISSVTTERSRKRKEAEARQTKYDALTTEQKLEMLAKRPGNSHNQTRKLTK